jgi:2-polyprenyl-3-methyl-5-hydroxy-6-metoxy-1,4-benzoquinol methylase
LDRKRHWNEVYTTKPAETVSWFRPHVETSFKLIQDSGFGKDAAVIDVGGGASTLVDDLLDHGYSDVSVLDIAMPALDVVKKRLDERAQQVTWIEGDITKVALLRHRYDVWHDRAVFHFLTDPDDRRAYIQQVLKAVRPGGLVIVASFATDGPEKCSGLPVMRYDPEDMHAQFGQAFHLLGHEREMHLTPAGKEQPFVYCFCRKIIS